MGLFKRKKEAEGDDALRLYYASDIHGTEVLWKKFLNAPKVYNARVLVMGGDITGKVVIPIVQEADGTWSARLFGGRQEARDEAELDSLERRVRGNGMYPYRTTHAEVDRIAGLPEEEREQWFESVMLHTFGEWIKLADDRLAGSGIRCFVMPGNDDPPGAGGLHPPGHQRRELRRGGGGVRRIHDAVAGILEPHALGLASRAGRGSAVPADP